MVLQIKENLANLLAKIPNNVKLVAVSKTHPTEIIKEAYDAGQRDFGENKVQELVKKYELLPKDICWHFIGHLQRNKVKYIVPFVHLIHSIDSIDLLLEVEKRASQINREIDCLFQVYIASETTKYGFNSCELEKAIAVLPELNYVKIKGLMGMATNTTDSSIIEHEFLTLKKLFDTFKSYSIKNFEMAILSMGMSSDYEIAIKCGSNCIRVGSSIFGNRQYGKY